MKQTAKILILLILLTIMIATCFSCNHNSNVPYEDVESSLNAALENFSANKYIKINGNYNINQIENSNYVSSFDLNMHKAQIEINDNNYYYFSNIRFEKNDNGIVVKDYISFEDMQKLLCTTLLNFHYDTENIRNLEKKDNIYMFEFIGVGASCSFHLDFDFTGGNMSIYVDKNNKIQKTIVSSKYLIGKTEYNYLSIANYEVLDSFSMETPQIYPTSDSRYAQYILDILSSKYEGKTLIEEIADFDTRTEIADIPNSQPNMKKVVSQVNENIVTLTIDFDKPLLIIGIDTATEKIQLMYTINNEFLSLKVNDSKKFIFK